MGRIIAFALHKGGVGKTTSLVNFAAILASKGFRVLACDSDPQCNTTKVVGPAELPQETIFTAYDDPNLIKQAIVKTEHGFDLLVGDVDLGTIDREFEEDEVNASEFKVFYNTLATLRDDYDFILLDTPPGIGFVLFSCLTAADEVLIPIAASTLATDGTQLLLNTIGHVKQRGLNPNIKVLAAFMTMLDLNSAHHVELYEASRTFMRSLGIHFCQRFIRYSTQFSAADKRKIPAVLAFHWNPIIKAYHDLVEEVLGLE